VLSRDFAQLRPLSAGTHFKARHLLQHSPPPDARGCHGLFERCFSALARLSERLEQLEDADALKVHGALAGMHLGPILFGQAFAEDWSQAFAAAERCGLLERTYLHMHLCIMGSYAGQWRAHCNWLEDSAHRELDLGDMYLFVRRDALPDIAELQVRHVRGQPVRVLECLYATRPWSTLSLLVDYVAACMREPGHLESPGLTLMELGWLGQLRRQTSELASTPSREGDRRGLHARLEKIERIQVMEKRRFWQMVDGPLPPALRARLLALWTDAHG
jgi:hypothetical protein